MSNVRNQSALLGLKFNFADSQHMLEPLPSPIDQVIANLRAQPIGSHAVADLALPEKFLGRVADRIIRAAFEQRFRIVVDDTLNSQEHANSPSTAVGVAAQDNNRGSADLGRPPLRGFRVTLNGPEHHETPFQLHAGASEDIKQAADIVARRIAHDGLVSTLAQVLARLGASRFVAGPHHELLQQVGLPVDWLEHFALRTQRPGQHLVQAVAEQLNVGVQPNDPVFRDATFRFKSTIDGFEVATESGEHDVAVLRMQLTRGSYWKATGDGGNLDLFRQMLLACPTATAIAHVEQRHLDEARNIVAGWNLGASDRVRFLPEAATVSQWAQDNAKVGHVDGQSFTLAPRYANRGEDGSTFVPGDTTLLASLQRAGLRVQHSPLLFQGGNVMAVREPRTGRRLLLLGEAEIIRNVSIGLSTDQALEAFRVEFGVDDCVVLPAASLHLDYDVTIRALHDRLVAFVNDEIAASRIVLRCAIEQFDRSRLMDPKLASQARVLAAAGKDRPLVELMGKTLQAHVVTGGLPLSLARTFELSPGESGVANLHRIMLAMDLLAAHAIPQSQWPNDQPIQTYWEALRRSSQSHAELVDALQRQGLLIVKVPSISAADRSLNALNGIQLSDRYLMPATGGLFEPLDRQAAATFQRAMGPSFKVIPIVTGESQRRSGAVRCSVSVYPKSQVRAPQATRGG